MAFYRTLLMAGVFLFFCQPLSAQIYRYTDENGIVHYTDNILNIPKAQRAGVPFDPGSAGADSPKSAETEKNPLPKQEEKTALPVLPVTEDAQPSDPQAQVIRIQNLKKSLDDEYAQLVRDQLSLAEEKKTLKNNTEVQAYNERAKQINARVDEYEKKRAQFEKEAAQFNLMIQERLGKIAPPPAAPQP